MSTSLNIRLRAMFSVGLIPILFPPADTHDSSLHYDDGFRWFFRIYFLNTDVQFQFICTPSLFKHANNNNH